ncbi:hypothetical protein [Streptomyces sp. NPDC102487]|uniref:hypothetical protein n=1 Tax=Streptomyces sp. NPDC102487 TaxID=3366182 RepID=UPI00380D3854
MVAFRLAISAAGGCTVGGALFTEGVWRHTFRLAAVGIGVLIAGVGGLLAATVLYAFRRLHEVGQAQLQHLDEERRRLEADMRERERALAAREAAAHRMMTNNGIRMSSTIRALDEALNAKAALQKRYDAVCSELGEVQDEFNQLVTQELQMLTDRFTSRGYGELRKPRAELRFDDIALNQLNPDGVVPLRRKRDV